MATPHKHAELIKQWADGAQIEWYNNVTDMWEPTGFHAPCWDKTTQYRVKPEPDVVRYCCLDIDGNNNVTVRSNYFNESAVRCDNLMVVFDGETGELKDAQVLANV